MSSPRSLVAALAALALLGGIFHGAILAQTPAADAAALPSPARTLAQAKSWGYQLQRIDPGKLAAVPYDVLVIDYSRNGSDARALTAEQVGRLKTGPDGGRRIVLAYISIGEAENYRYYWQPEWDTTAPPWLGDANRKYRSNFPVRYWHADWQAIIFRGANNYLDRILNAGFDGIYLDRVDVYQEFEQENAAAGAEMIAFVQALAAHARSLKPGFLVVPQNAEELLEDAGYRALIDGIAKEDLLFGDSRSKHPNAPDVIDTGVRNLSRMTGDGKPVFVVEYLDKPENIAAARTQIEGYGFIPHFAKRGLDVMRVGDLPPPRPPRTPRN
jgi:cysteinyl-tRNA synthetase, unknown class